MNTNQGNRPQNFGQQRTFRPSMPMGQVAPDCKNYGKKHFGPCSKAMVVCFNCKQKGHYANECPEKNSVCKNCGKIGHWAKNCRAPDLRNNFIAARGAPQANQPRARTFNMSMQDAVRDANVVAGTLPINSVNAKV